MPTTKHELLDWLMDVPEDAEIGTDGAGLALLAILGTNVHLLDIGHIPNADELYAEAIEAWGFRAAQDRGELLSRAEVAAEWFRDEYEPVVELLREADLIGRGTETEAYMRISHLRYLVLRTHDWNDAVVDAIRRDLDDGKITPEHARRFYGARVARRGDVCDPLPRQR